MNSRGAGKQCPPKHSLLPHAVSKVHFLIRIIFNKELESNGYLKNKNFETVAHVSISIWHLEQGELRLSEFLIQKEDLNYLERFLVRFEGVWVGCSFTGGVSLLAQSLVGILNDGG